VRGATDYNNAPTPKEMFSVMVDPCSSQGS
jgi:hypothetical protein